MKTVQEYKEQFLADGWTENWGDGALNKPDICILVKELTVPLRDWEIPPNGHRFRYSREYVVLSTENPPVTFIDVASYRC